MNIQNFIFLKKYGAKSHVINFIFIYMKVLFLDIDGVLNVYPQGRDKYGSKFHSHFEENLKRIIDETGAKIVISSTWRLSGLNVMQEMWKDRSLPGDVIDITVNGGINRGDEIQQYINNGKVSNYCILDDDNDMLPSQKNNFVRTANNSNHPDCIDIGYGLTNICTDKAILILNG